MIEANVEIENKFWIKELKIPKKYFTPKLSKIRKIIKFFKKKNIIFSICLTNSLNVKKLNKKFRKKNKPTDALAFPFYTLKYLKMKKEKKIYIGDIAVSYEIIKSRSKNNNFFTEFDKVWVHALLHLIGYNHIRNKDFFIMQSIEKKILSSLYK